IVEINLYKLPSTRDLRVHVDMLVRASIIELARSADTTGLVNHEAIGVHFQLGDIFANVVDDRIEAKKQYEKAADLAKQVCVAEPTDAQAYLDLSISYVKIADFYLETERNSKAALE